MDPFKVYLIEADGEAVHAGFTTLEREQMDPGDVVVRIRYASVNYKDALAATGRGKIIRRFPCVGGYAALTRVPADWVNLVPASLTDLDAITIGVAGYTSALGVDLMELNGIRPD